MPALKNLTGQTFGTLTVTARAAQDDHHMAAWHVTCTCGAQRVVRGTYLTSGTTKTCGNRKFHQRAATVAGEHQDYYQVHRAIRAQYGPASESQCIICDDMATEWSYNGECCDERMGPGGTQRFCPHASRECYSPVCRTCHRALDAILREEVAA